MAMLQPQRLQVCTDGERESAIYWLWNVECWSLLNSFCLLNICKVLVKFTYSPTKKLISNERATSSFIPAFRKRVWWVSAARAGRNIIIIIIIMTTLLNFWKCYPRNMRIILLCNHFYAGPEVYPEISTCNYNHLPSLALWRPTGKEALRYYLA